MSVRVYCPGLLKNIAGPFVVLTSCSVVVLDGAKGCYAVLISQTLNLIR